MLAKLKFHSKRILKEHVPGLLYLPRYSTLWTGVKSLLLTIPVAAISYVSIDFRGAPPPGQVEFLAYLAKHQWLFFALLLAPCALVFVLEKWEKFTAKRTREVKPDTDEFGAILKGIDEVVAVKGQSIATYSLKVRAARGKRSSAFTEIAKPLKQIEQNMVQLYYVLRELTDDDGIKLVLTQIKDGDPSGYAVYLPNDSAPSERMLQTTPRKTLFFYAARDEEIKVIPDIEAYLKLTKAAQRMYCSSADDEDKGSIIVMPVVHKTWAKVVYCLSIKSSIPNTFTDSGKKRYKRICDYFLKRILIEHTLEMILNNTDEA